MWRFLLTTLVVVAAVTTRLAVADTPTRDARPGDPPTAGLHVASQQGALAANPNAEIDPNGWGFWKKLRRALKKIRDFIDAILQHTNDDRGSQGTAVPGRGLALLDDLRLPGSSILRCGVSPGAVA